MCPDDTVFDQENFICANWFEIDCQSSTLFYDKNLQLFQPNPKDETNSTAVQEEPSEQERRQQAQQVASFDRSAKVASLDRKKKHQPPKKNPRDREFMIVIALLIHCIMIII